MKKILSLILTFAMVFSLAMPAMAASVTGNTSSNVTASYTPTYSITVSTDANGTVTANPTAAAEGTLVTLTITPNSGYELDALSINDGDITAAKVEDGKYTFTMPASAVTVSATFKVAAQKYAIEIAKAATDYVAGTVTGTITSNVSEAAEGETVKLFAHPSDGYELDKVIIKFEVSGSTEYKTLDKDLSFNMPASKVTVQSYFVLSVVEPKITSLYVTIDGVRYDSTNTSAENPATIYSDSTYKVIVTGTDFDKLDMTAATNNPSVQYARGYAAFVNSAWSVDASSNTATFTISSMRDTSTAFEISYANKEDSISGTSNRNYHGSGVYIVYVNIKKPVYYNVTIADDIVNGKVTAEPTSAAEGATITLTVTPNAGFELDALTINNDAITATKGEDGKYTFTMPAGNVTVNATFKMQEPTYAITITEGIQYGTVVSDKAEAKNGETVKLTIIPAEGYELDTLTVGGHGVAADQVQNGVYTFNMGKAAVEINATFKKINYTITVNSSENGSVTALATATMGETVKLTWTTDAAYELGNISVKDANGNEVSITDKGLTEWTFVMPASNVTITATFNKLPITSADIVWGSMAFTYSDEQVVQADGSTADKGWSNDGSEGAGTVTVKNTGDNTFTAQVAYTAVTEYDEIAGTFDVTSAELVTEASQTFTLTLKNKPGKAIAAGTKIGEVTITINEAAEE